ncbi:MAG: hypothetical protein AVDCRST_MAG71-36 [uncultured Lysobacter sp.]|uniref:Uncharacterized protein n=1 Tax=uncultured Lysobacter sp. TaxID=271060 RepID=A0A6J4KA02_9GAMM|nr:MAG: hypothetical protein AVDCRST_MAG71-36 [uncultured Lysobacter sp.]
MFGITVENAVLLQQLEPLFFHAGIARVGRMHELNTRAYGGALYKHGRHAFACACHAERPACRRARLAFRAMWPTGGCTGPCSCRRRSSLAARQGRRCNRERYDLE